MNIQPQPFAPVIVTIKEVEDTDLRFQIDVQMIDYEQKRAAFAEAINKVNDANAALLAATGERDAAKVKLVRLFAQGSEKVRMEPNWEPFRECGFPAVENFMTERDRRNFARLHKAGLSNAVREQNLNTHGLFEGDQGQSS